MFYIIATAGYLLAIAWLVYVWHLHGARGLVVCPSRLLLHIECPACGTSRALVYALKGDILMAARTNINGLTAATGLIAGTILLAYDFIMRRRLTYQLCVKLNDLAATKGGIAVCVLYVVVLIAGKLIGRMFTA